MGQNKKKNKKKKKRLKSNPVNAMNEQRVKGSCGSHPVIDFISCKLMSNQILIMN